MIEAQILGPAPDEYRERAGAIRHDTRGLLAAIDDVDTAARIEQDALVLRPGASLSPDDFERFLASHADLSPKAWPRYVRINDQLPATATNKILKRALIAAGVTAQDGLLWTRPARGTGYAPVDETTDRRAASTLGS